jgi:hypothetical protein
VRASPKRERERNGIDVDPGPPRRLVAIAMQLALMAAANRDGIFVADRNAFACVKSWPKSRY